MCAMIAVLLRSAAVHVGITVDHVRARRRRAAHNRRGCGLMVTLAVGRCCLRRVCLWRATAAPSFCWTVRHDIWAIVFAWRRCPALG